ncbi:hypothetical protein ScPMuIL_018634 [Solemya velum]
MASKKGGGDSSSSKSSWLAVDNKPVKIDKWDTAALKNALDDAAKKVMLEKYGYRESTHLIDLRLLICTVGVGFAMFALVWDYLRPFPESRPILIISSLTVLRYFVLMGVLTLYTTYKEKGIFLVALDKDKAGVDPDNVWTLASYLRKYDDIYQLTMTYKKGETGLEREDKMSKSVANFFDENGVLCSDLYEPIITSLQSKLSTEKKE